jgi:hypothetical protein
VSESLRPLRTLDWGSIITLVLLVIGGVVAFVVVREKQANMIDDITDLRAKDRVHDEAIAKMREDRSIETKINDLTIEVRLLRQEVEQSNKDKRRQ